MSPQQHDAGSRHIGGSQVTERMYRRQLRPVIQTGATAMDDLFGGLDQGQANGA
jgi:hypothetical protein